MNYDAALAWLERIQGRGIKLGLENVTRLLEVMGRPQETFVSVIVGGTNGKGSVSAFIASILKRAGLRAGLYTSPHLCRYEERIMVDGIPVTPGEFARAMTRVRDAVGMPAHGNEDGAVTAGGPRSDSGGVEPHAPATGATGALTAHPTHFEVLTAGAIDHFHRAGVDVAVFEVGMGGRLDATRVVRAPVAVITSIGLEHTRFLGTTLEAIAAEKAGIIESSNALSSAGRAPSSPRVQRVVSGVEEGPAARVIREKAAACGAALVEAGREGACEAIGSGASSPVVLRTSRRDYGELRLPLAGRHQRLNALIAVLAVEALRGALAECDEASRSMAGKIDAAAIVSGLEAAHWPGRLQRISASPLVLIDGAHNPAGCEALRESIDALRAEGGFRRLCLVLGIMDDKDVTAMARTIVPVADHLILTKGRSPRFRGPEIVLRDIPAGGPVPAIEPDPAAALAAARAWCDPEDAVLICGSLYLVGDVLAAEGIDPFGSGSLAAVGRAGITP